MAARDALQFLLHNLLHLFLDTPVVRLHRFFHAVVAVPVSYTHLKEQPRLSPCRISAITHTLETEFIPVAVNKGLYLSVKTCLFYTSRCV